MVQIILLTGAEGVGKSTLARELEAKNGFEEFTFAGGVRRALIPLWKGFAEMMAHYNVNMPALSMDMTYHRTLKEAPLCDATLGDQQVSPRVLMQWLGTDVMRRFVCEDIWALALVGVLRQCIAVGVDKFVISDLRFANELEVVKSMSPSCRVVRIEHCDEDERLRLRKVALEGHVSMQGWMTPPADCVVHNTFDSDGLKGMRKRCLDLN